MAANPLKVIVLDENKEPISGVKLTAVEQNKSLFTDFDGESELYNPNEVRLYKIDCVGYESGYIKVSRSEKSEIKIVLRKK